MGEFQSGIAIYSHRKSGILKLDRELYHCKSKCIALEAIQISSNAKVCNCNENNEAENVDFSVNPEFRK